MVRPALFLFTQPSYAMTPFKKLISALGKGQVDLSTGTYEMLYTAGVVPDTGDTGHEFEADLITAGGEILHRQAIACTWDVLNPRTFDFADFSLLDPGGATTATHAAIIRMGGSAATNRLICTDDIADHTFDGTNDSHGANASGAFKLG